MCADVSYQTDRVLGVFTLRVRAWLVIHSEKEKKTFLVQLPWLRTCPNPMVTKIMSGLKWEKRDGDGRVVPFFISVMTYFKGSLIFKQETLNCQKLHIFTQAPQSTTASVLS